MSSVAGVGVVTYRVRRVHVAHLTPGSVALVIHTSAVVKARRKNESYVAIYQTRGDVLPGVYIYGGAVSGQLRRASRAARRSAGNLA